MTVYITDSHNFRVMEPGLQVSIIVHTKERAAQKVAKAVRQGKPPIPHITTERSARLLSVIFGITLGMGDSEMIRVVNGDMILAYIGGEWMSIYIGNAK